MLRNVSGAHIQLITEESRRLFKSKAGCIKVCHPAFSVDLLREFHDINPDAPVCARLIDDGANFSNMRAKTQQAIRLFEPAFKYFEGLFYVEILPNEKYSEGAELTKLGEMSIPCAEDIVRAGALPVMLNLSVANPKNPADIRLVYDAVEQLNKFNGLIDYHNYTVPHNQLSYDLDLRHVRMSAYLPIGTRWWLGEGLYDHGIIDGRLAGWRDASFHQSPEDVSRYVRRIAQKLSADRSVVAWTPFGAGPANDWLSFQYDNESIITQVFTEMYEVWSMPKLGQGLQRMITYLGQPLEDEVYHFAGTPMEASLAVFENGTATWFKAANETVGIRSDGTIFTDKGNNGDGSSVWQVWP